MYSYRQNEKNNNTTLSEQLQNVETQAKSIPRNTHVQ
jgi:hypothetical protein